MEGKARTKGGYRSASLILSLILLALPVRAQEVIWVIANPEHAAHGQFIQGLRDSLSRTTQPIPALRLLRPAELASISTPEHPILSITVGSRAAEFLNKAKLEPQRELHALIPQAAYQKLYPQPQTDSSPSKHSAIYVDQPISRLLRLACLVLADSPRIGVLLGPWSRIHEDELKRTNKVVNIHTIADKKQLIPALQGLLPRSNLLLALPDPAVYNRSSAHAVLLNSYRHRVPVLAFSRSYTHAGALLSLYSTPEQIGRQAGELVTRLATTGAWKLPPPAHPRYFTVSVNRQVAYSMGLSLPTEAELTTQLNAGEGSP